MSLSELELLLRITHRAVSADILERQAGRRHYFVRGLFHYSGSSSQRMVTLDEKLVIENGAAANGGPQ